MIGILSLTPDFVVTQWNDWLASLTGRPYAGVVGQNIFDVFPDLEERGIAAALRYAVETSAPLTLSHALHRYVFPAADGAPVSQSAQIQPLAYNGRNMGLFVVVQDVSDRALMETELQRRVSHLEALHEINRLILAGEFEAGLQLVTRAAVSLFEASHAEVLVLDGDRLIPQAMAGPEPPSDSLAYLRLGEGIIGDVAATGQSACVLDVTADARYVSVNPRTRAEMAAPLIAEDRVLGVLNVESARAASFVGDAPALLESLAAAAAKVLHTAASRRTEQRRLRDLTLLRELGLRLTQAPEPQMVYDLGVEYAVRILEASAAFLYLYEPQTDTAHLAPVPEGPAAAGAGAADRFEDRPGHPPAAVLAATGLTFAAGPGLPGLVSNEFYVPRLGGLVHSVARGGRMLVIGDPASHPHYGPDLATRRKLKAIAAFPLLRGGRTLGVLAVLFAYDRAIGPADEDLLSLLAEQLAGQIDSAQFRAIELRRMEEMEDLRRLSGTLRQVETQAEIQATLLDEVLALFQVASAAVLYPNPGEQVLRVAETRGLNLAADHGGFPLETTLFGRVFHSGQPWQSGDVQSDADGGRQLAEVFAGERGLRSAVAVPLRVGPHVTGVLFVGSERPDRFTSSDLRVLGTIAEMVGGALHRTGLFEQTEHRAQQLALLNDLGRQLAANLDPAALYDMTVPALVERFGYALAIIVEPDAAASELVLKAKAGANTEAVPLGLRTPQHGVMGHVVHTGRTYLTNDGRHDPFYIAWKEIPVGSELCVPIYVEGQVAAVLNLEQPFLHAFSPADADMVEALAAQLGIALTNARHFQHIQRTAARLAVFNQATERLAEAPDLSAALATTLDAACDIVGCERGGIFVAENDGRLRLVQSRGVSRAVVAQLAAADLTVETGIFGEAFRARQPIEIPDTAVDPRLVPLPGYTGEALYCAPLMLGDQPLAAVDLARLPPDDEARTLLAAFCDRAAVAAENAALYEQTVRLAQERAALLDISTLLSASTDLDAVVKRALESVRSALGVDVCALTWLTDDGQALTLAGQLFAEAEHRPAGPSQPMPLSGLATSRRAIAERRALVSPETQAEAEIQRWRDWLRDHRLRSGMHVPLVAEGQVIGLLYMSEYHPAGRAGEVKLSLAQGIANQAAVAIQRAQLYEQARRRAEQLAAVNALGQALSETLDLPEIYARLTAAASDLLPNLSGVAISLYDQGRERLTCVQAVVDGRPLDAAALAALTTHVSGLEPYQTLARTRRPLILSGDVQTIVASTLARPPAAALYVPLVFKGQLVGVLEAHGAERASFGQADAELLGAVATTAAIAIQNAGLLAETERRLRHLQTLHNVDVAISASLDLRVTLNVLLDQLVNQLGVDAGLVLLLNPHTQEMEFAAGRGLRTKALEHHRLRLGEGLPGRVVLERQVVHVSNLMAGDEKAARAAALAAEGFVGYFGVPIMAKGQVKGVLEIFHRRRLEADSEWLGFLETLAGQAAVAIENTTLFDGLQRSNIELALAYDATIEGWSRALELRDRETEGHTQRVTEMTLRLARALGFDEKELVHVRRGALLHDIGKMGIPDTILLKPGPLTDEEWAIMRQHPQYAFDMLQPIAYLRPALDIPYGHHECWDGTGYPRGLKGPHIPLTARIFAVVDVWDALGSDRPYRAAWPEARVLEHIRASAGTHFDPEIVDIFMRTVQGRTTMP